MTQAKILATAVAALTLAAAGPAHADDGAGSAFVRTRTLVPHSKPAPQSAPQPAPQAAPHSATPPASRPFAHEHHWHARPFFVPAPIFVPPYYDYDYYGYYGYAPPVYAPPPAYVAPPPDYIERGDGYWYYCPELGAYYPDIMECPGPWQPVLPR